MFIYQLIYLVKEHLIAKTRNKPSRYRILHQEGLFLVFKSDRIFNQLKESGGAMRDRTADLLRARQALSQLSYSPSVISCPVDSHLIVHFEAYPGAWA